MSYQLSKIFLFTSCLVAVPCFADRIKDNFPLNCKAGEFLQIQGTVTEDILDASVTVKLDGEVVVQAPNIKYKQTASGRFYELVEDESAARVKADGLYYVPVLIEPKIGESTSVQVWLPVVDDQGKPEAVLARSDLLCE